MKSYYRIPPGNKIKVAVDFDTPAGGQVVHWRCRIHDCDLKEVASMEGPTKTLKPGKQTSEMEFQLPPLDQIPSVYSDSTSNNNFNVMFEMKCSHLQNDLMVQRFAVTFADAAGPTLDPAVIIDGREYKHQGKLLEGQLARFDLPQRPQARSVYHMAAKGNRRLTWLVRQTNLAWQVRNASVADKKDYLEIGPLTNTVSLRKEVVIVPLESVKAPYVHRLRKINGAHIYPWSKSGRDLKIKVLEVLGPAEIEILTDKKPQRVTGTDTWNYDDLQGVLNLLVKAPGTFVVKF